MPNFTPGDSNDSPSRSIERRGRSLVLAIDDSDDVLKFIEAVLQDSCDLAFADSGVSGLEKAHQHTPDLIITDILMPNGSGEEFIRAIREQRTFENVPILVLTGKTDDVLRAKLLHNGAQDFCQKPLSHEELSARVSNLLQLKRVRDLLEEELQVKNSNLEELVRESSFQRNQLSQLARQLQTIQEEERTRISREIHDEFGQALTVMKMRLFDLGARLEEHRSVEAPIARALASDVSDILGIARKLAYELRPSILQDFGLTEAITTHVKDFSTKTKITCSSEFSCLENETLPSEIATVLYRVIQESLTNVARHANATTVSITIEREEDGIKLSIGDNGKGIDLSSPEKHFSIGIVGMRERVLAVSGKFLLINSDKGGALLKVAIPLKARINK